MVQPIHRKFNNPNNISTALRNSDETSCGLNYTWRKKYFKCTQQLWIWSLETEVKYYSSSKGHKSSILSADVWIHLLLYVYAMMVGYLIYMQL